MFKPKTENLMYPFAENLEIFLYIRFRNSKEFKNQNYKISQSFTYNII